MFFLMICTFSAIISLWSVYADPVINPDGILYVNAANAFIEGKYDEAISFYKWPFYSILIGIVSRITSISTEYTAHLLNYIFNVISCISFVLLIKTLGAKKTTIFIAALVIVFFPGLNEIRAQVVRDHGYIAFNLTSLYFLIRSLELRCIKFLFASIFSIFIATLFRIEGFVFLIAIPLIYTLTRYDEKPISRISAYVFTVIISIILISVFGWWLYVPEDGDKFSLFSLESVQSGWSQVNTYIDKKVTVLKEDVLNTSSDSTGLFVFLWTVTGIICTQVILILSIPYTFLTGYAFSKKLIFPARSCVKPWKLFIYFNIGILTVFTLTKLFLTDRYPLSLATTILLCVPFALVHLYENFKQNPHSGIGKKLAVAAILLILFVNCFEGLTSKTNKTHYKKAGIWLSENVADDSTMLTNNHIVGFYSKLKPMNITAIHNMEHLVHQLYLGEWINYNYIVLSFKPSSEFEEILKKAMWVEPREIFKNHRGNEVRIYDINAYRQANVGYLESN